jgi:hypothetical protein
MVMNKKFAFTLAIAIAIPLSIACAAPAENKPSDGGGLTGDPTEPDWVGLGAGLFPGDSGAVLYATGFAQKDKNMNSQQQMAKNRAQINLAEQIGAKVKALTQEYVDQFKDYYVEGSESSLEGFKRCTEVQVNEYLSGATPIAFWVCRNPGNNADEYTGAYFVLIKLDPAKVFQEYKEEVKNRARAQANATREKIKVEMDDMLKQLDDKLDGDFDVYVQEAAKGEKPKITIK